MMVLWATMLPSFCSPYRLSSFVAVPLSTASSFLRPKTLRDSAPFHTCAFIVVKCLTLGVSSIYCSVPSR